VPFVFSYSNTHDDIYEGSTETTCAPTWIQTPLQSIANGMAEAETVKQNFQMQLHGIYVIVIL